MRNKDFMRETICDENRLNMRVLICLESLSVQKLFSKIIEQLEFVFNQLYKQHISSKTDVG